MPRTVEDGMSAFPNFQSQSYDSAFTQPLPSYPTNIGGAAFPERVPHARGLAPVADDVDEILTEKTFVDTLLPYVTPSGYTWVRLQHEKREQKRNEKNERSERSNGSSSSSPYEHYRDTHQTDVMTERTLRMTIEDEPMSRKKSWAMRLLGKLHKDVLPAHRDHFVRSIVGTLGDATPECVMTNGDVRGRMRRIDCFRQSNKVWRLDIVTLVLFRGLPLESTDGERLGKTCNRDVCIQPQHLHLNVKEIDMVLAKVLSGAPRDPLLMYETKSAFDLEELWKHHSVTFGKGEGYANSQAGYAHETMSISPTASSVGRSASTPSAPIPVHAHKRGQSSFDEDTSDLDGISDCRVNCGSHGSRVNCGSHGSDYHSVSSPKVKAEAASPMGTLSFMQTGSALSMPSGVPGSPSYPKEGLFSLSCAQNPLSRSMDNGGQYYSQQSQQQFAHNQPFQHMLRQALPRLPQQQPQRHQPAFYPPMRQQQQQSTSAPWNQLDSTSLEPLQALVNRDGGLATSMHDPSPASEAGLWNAQSNSSTISPSMPALMRTQGHDESVNPFFPTPDQVASGVHDGSANTMLPADLFGGPPHARSLPVGTGGFVPSSVPQSEPTAGTLLTSPSPHFSQWNHS